jgi:hypothetical protein
MSKRHASGGDMTESGKPHAIPIVSPDGFRRPNGTCVGIATAHVSNLRHADEDAEASTNPRSA